VVEVNDEVQARMLDKIASALDGGISGKTVAVLGLSFKPNTDDVRESPALVIVRGLLAGGAAVRAYDPEAIDALRELLKEDSVSYCKDAYDAADGADALVIVTEWNQFRKLELDRLHLKRPLIVDLRNLYEPEKMAAAGFHYVSIGRPEGRPQAQVETAQLRAVAGGSRS
jgi:UDPglucose 6-dehydrogenase